MAGLVVTKTKELGDLLKFHQNATGAVLGPFDSFLTIRGMETLAYRYKIHSQNALQVAQYLQDHPKIKNIYYPGLKSHPQYELAKKQQKYSGGVISFDLKDDTQDNALKVIQGLKLFHLGDSLGGIKSLSNLPSQMSHQSVPYETKIASGITDSLIRLSVGLEEPEELIKDLQQALEKL